MGLDINGTRLLLYARTLGVNFAQTATIGRQGMHLSANDLAKNLGHFGFDQPEKLAGEALKDFFAEHFLRLLGAERVDSFDASPYENAAYVHDMNLPIRDEFKGRYTAVLDGGSLEHVFNYPTSIKNCMEMTAIGGHFIAITPTNNFMGHGFYQFSPELFFSVFTEENGFDTPRVILFEDRPDAAWREVPNPKALGRRVTLCNETPTYLFVMSRRVRTADVFATTPQQSDYVAAWGTKT